MHVEADARKLDGEWKQAEQALRQQPLQQDGPYVPEGKPFNPGDPLSHYQPSEEPQLKISQEEAMLETRGLPLPTNVVNGAQTVAYENVMPTAESQHIQTPMDERRGLPMGTGAIPMPDQSSGETVVPPHYPQSEETIEVPPALALPEGRGLMPSTPWTGGKLGLSYPHKSGKEITLAANEAAESSANNTPQPTDAQKEAGNYKKGHVKVGTHDITIENPHGSTRSGTSPDGKKWSQKMHGHYGYFKGAMGEDKDHIDVFVKDDAAEDELVQRPVYVVEQVDPKQVCSMSTKSSWAQRMKPKRVSFTTQITKRAGRVLVICLNLAIRQTSSIG